MHIKLSEAMQYLGMTQADLAEVIPDPFGNTCSNPVDVDIDDIRWYTYAKHLNCVMLWERNLVGKARNLFEREEVLSRFVQICMDAGYVHSPGSRVMSWFLTEIKNPDQEFVR